MLENNDCGDLVAVTMDAMWETTEMVPIGTVRRFTKEEHGVAGWGVAWNRSTARNRIDYPRVPVTIFVGAKMPDSPRNKFTLDGVDYDEPEPNWGVEERFIETAVRSLDPSKSDGTSYRVLH